MASTTSQINLSILSIPAFIFMALFPRFWSIRIATNGDMQRWDNRNPRSTTLRANLKKTLDASTFRAFERAESAHANAMENIPIFTTAVVLGNMAKLPLGGWDGMNAFAAAYLVVRALHMYAYIVTDRQSYSFFRGPLFILSIALCVNIMVKAASELVY